MAGAVANGLVTGVTASHVDALVSVVRLRTVAADDIH
jgi:hypothetical protein